MRRTRLALLALLLFTPAPAAADEPGDEDEPSNEDSDDSDEDEPSGEEGAGEAPPQQGGEASPREAEDPAPGQDGPPGQSSSPGGDISEPTETHTGPIEAKSEPGESEGEEEEGEEEEGEEEPADTENTTAASELPSDVRESIVVTATGEPRLLSDAPIPVRLVDEEAIRSSAASDAADLLRRVPGIPVMSQGIDRRGGVSGISLQGLPAGRTLVLVDGRPVSGDVGGVVDLSQFPAAMLERVEIVEGPMSALYGSDALGGVINLITRKPPPGAFVAGHVQGASDRSIDASVTASAAQRDGFSWGTTATVRHAAAIDLAPSDPATDLDQRSSAGIRLFASLRRPRNRLEFGAFYQHDSRDGVFQRTNNAINYTSVFDSRKRHDRLDGSLAWRQLISEKLQLRWEVDATDYSFRLDEDLRESPVGSVRRARTGSVSGRWRIEVRALPWASLLAGVEGGRESLRVFQDRDEAGGGQRRLEEVAPTAEWSIEPWVQGDLRLFGDRLELVPGLRLSAHDAYGAALAPSLAIRLKLWQGATLRLSGGRGYRAPSLEERHLVFDHAALGYVVYGSPDLQPESSWGANLSLEQSIRQLLVIRIGGYANRLTDLITYVYDGSASTDGLNVYRSTNIAGARTVGAQATADLRLPWLHATVAYRFLWAWSDDGFFLPDAPIHGLRGTAEVKLAKIGLSLYNGIGWESERYVDDVQGLRSPGLVRWDVRIEKRFTGKHEMAIFVGVDNLLNQRRDPEQEGDFRPVEGRRVLVGVRGALNLPRKESASP